MKKNHLIVFSILTFILLLSTHIYIYLYTPPDNKGEVKSIFIPPKASFRWIALKLKEEGIIRDAESFSLFARFKGAIKNVKAGEYEFSTSMLPADVLHRLTRGVIKDYLVTIPEGYNIYQIASLLEGYGLVSKEEFLQLAFDKDFVASLGINGISLEGYLFPDTYRFNKLMGAEGIIKKMINHFNEVYSRFIEDKAIKRGLSRSFVVTLASIIEKEAGIDKEKSLISAVFYNRLKMGLRLQSDPTVIYGLPTFNGNLKKEDLMTPTPYNTYIIHGLPPGPIANPGRSSLLAAVEPAPVSYLYFVSRNDGSHVFSRTLKEHNRAVSKYQKGS